jgi:hypothetical protein
MAFQLTNNTTFNFEAVLKQVGEVSSLLERLLKDVCSWI